MPNERDALSSDLILTKLISFRPQDQLDIETLLIANRDDIHVDEIRREWSALSTGEAERTAWFEAAIARSIVSAK